MQFADFGHGLGLAFSETENLCQFVWLHHFFLDPDEQIFVKNLKYDADSYEDLRYDANETHKWPCY